MKSDFNETQHTIFSLHFMTTKVRWSYDQGCWECKSAVSIQCSSQNEILLIPFLMLPVPIVKLNKWSKITNFKEKSVCLSDKSVTKNWWILWINLSFHRCWMQMSIVSTNTTKLPTSITNRWNVFKATSCDLKVVTYNLFFFTIQQNAHRE